MKHGYQDALEISDKNFKKSDEFYPNINLLVADLLDLLDGSHPEQGWKDLVDRCEKSTSAEVATNEFWDHDAYIMFSMSAQIGRNWLAEQPFDPSIADKTLAALHSPLETVWIEPQTHLSDRPVRIHDCGLV